MAGRSDIEAGKAHVRLYVKRSELQQGLKAVGSDLQGLGSGIMRIGGMVAGLGAAIIAPFALALATFTSVGGAIADMHSRTGLAVGAIGELGFAARQTGADIADVEKSVGRMQQTITDAEKGSKTAKDALAALGLTAADLKGKLPEDQLSIVAEHLTAIEDPARKTDTAMDVLGKSGKKLIPMLANLKALREEARRLGLAPTEKAVEDADKLGDAWDALKDVAKATAFEIGAALAPSLIPAAESIKNIAGFVNRWVRENGALIRTVAMVGAGLVAAGAIITVIGAGIFALGAIISGVAAVIAFLGSVFAALVSPIGLTVAAVTAAIVAWTRYTASGRAAVTYLTERLGEFLAFGKEVFGGIADALMAGDLALAGRVAMAGLMLAVETGKLAIIESWHDLKISLFAIWDEVRIQAQAAVAFIAGAFTSFGQQLAAQFPEVFAALSAAWSGFEAGAIAAFQSAMKGAMGFLSMMKLVTAGITAAFTEAQKLTPGAVNAAVAGANAGTNASTGIDIAQIVADAERAREQAEANARAGAAGGRMSREADRAGAIDAAAAAVAGARAELDAALAKAATARKDIEARKGAGDDAGPVTDSPDVVSLKRQALVTFSGAGLMASAAGGGNLQMQQVRLAQRQVQQGDVIHQDLVTLKDKKPPGMRP
jgi:hypothetical protein